MAQTNLAKKAPIPAFVPNADGIIRQLPPLSAQPSHDEREARKAYGKALAEAAAKAPMGSVRVTCGSCAMAVPEHKLASAAFVALGHEIPESTEDDPLPTWDALEHAVHGKALADAREEAGLPPLPEHACAIGEAFVMTASGPEKLNVPQSVLDYIRSPEGAAIIRRLAGN